MPRKGHTEEQYLRLAASRRRPESGRWVCREMGISQQAFYSWEERLRGIGFETSCTLELRQLREENGKLKTLVADLSLDKHIWQEAAIKKGLESLRHAGSWCRVCGRRMELGEKRACELIGITRWTNRYRSRRDGQADLRMRLRELAGTRTRYGYRRLTVLLRREGRAVNA